MNNSDLDIHYEKAKQYLSEMREIGKVASRNALILLVALVVIWLGSVESVFNQVQIEKQQEQAQEELETKVKNQSEQINKIQRDQKRLSAKIEQFSSSVIPDTLIEQAKNKERTLVQTSQSSEEEKKKLEEQKQEIESYKSVSMKTPFFEGTLPINVAPLFLSISISGFILYLALSRLAMLSLYTRALEKLKTLDNNGERELTIEVFSLPWWLAPFPYLDKKEDTFDIRDAQGWKLNSPFTILKVVIALVCLCLVQFRVLWIAWITSDDIFKAPYKDPFEYFFYPVVGLSIFLMLVGLWLWFRPWQEPHRDIDRDKREFCAYLILFISSAFLASVTAVIDRQSQNSQNQMKEEKSVSNPKNHPRFNTKKQKRTPFFSTLAPLQFYLNPEKKQINSRNKTDKSQKNEKGIIHYVLKDKSILKIYQTKYLPNQSLWKDSSDLPVLSLEKSTNPHVHLSASSFSFELAAIKSLNDKNYERACQLLLAGINHDLLFQVANLGKKPSLRLYDLLAGLALRYNQNIYFDKMILLIGKNPDFKARLDKWKNKESKWHKKWSNSQKKIKWEMTIMKTEKPNESKKIKNEPQFILL